MKAKEYLRTIRSEQRELKTLIERRQTLYFSVLPSGIQYDKDLIKSTSDDHMVDKLMKKMELDEVIDKYIVMLTTHKAEAMKIIKEIDNSLYRQVLINYYIIVIYIPGSI